MFLRLVVLLALFSSCSQLKKIPQPKGVAASGSPYHLRLVKDLDPTYAPGKLPIGLSSPVFLREDLYVGTADGQLLEIDTISKAQTLILKETTPIFAPVTVSEQLLFAATYNGDLIAWSHVERKEKFRVNLGSPLESPMTLSQGRLYVPLRNHALMSLDALTGKILWSYKRPVTAAKTLHRRGSVLVIGNKVIMGFADGHLLCFRQEDGSVLWETKVTEAESRHFQDIISEPIYFEGKIWTYAYQGYLKAYKLDSGTLEKTVLEKPTSNLLVHSGAIYFANSLGDIIKLDQKLEAGIVHPKLSKSLIYQISPWKDQFVLNDHKGEVYWISQVSRTLTMQFHLGHVYSTVFGSMASDELSIALISSRNRLYLFQ